MGILEMKMLQNVSFCAVACVILTAAPALAADHVIKVGMIATLSGPSASLGENIDRGAQLYLDNHQAELPPGVKVEIIKRDDTGPNPGVAKRLAQELIVRDHVQFLGGIVFTPNAAAIAPLATESKTPLVLMNASTSNLTRLSPYIARVSYTQWQTAHTLGQWAARNGFKKVFIAVSDYAAGIDSEKAFEAGFVGDGRQIIGRVHMPQSTPDYVPYMQSVKDAKPDALFMFTNAGRITTAAVKGFAEAGLTQAGITLLGPGDIASDEELDNMGDAALGTTTAAIYSANDPRPENVAFIKLWKKAYGNDSIPSFMAVCGWDGMAAIFSAIKAQKGVVTGDGSMQVLKTWSNPSSPRGPIAIDPETRDVMMDVYIDKVQKVGNKLVNVNMETIHNVKDQWKILNPQ
jgi:branched-chain amino acid transport system substrate-binding protein